MHKLYPIEIVLLQDGLMELCDVHVAIKLLCMVSHMYVFLYKLYLKI